MNTLAIDVGGTKFSVALFEGERIARRESRATDRSGGPEWMLERVEEIAASWKFERCAIGFGGPVDYAVQKIVLSTHVGGWREFPLTERIRDRFAVPVIMDNDANVGALGEAIYGAGRGARPLFYMTLSTGIGGGIVLEDSTVYRGADSYAGELGHMTLKADGR
jgi:glucokinase